MTGRRLVVGLLIVVSLLTSCGTSDPVVIEKEVTEVVTEKIVETVVVEGAAETIEKQVTRVVEVEKVITATPEPELGPAVGGKLVYALPSEPDTLDVHKSSSLAMEWVMQYVGASLITKHPESGEFLPYLAESWTVAEDGLTYEFKLREDVKFHDGTPLTAQEYAWTFQRALDPRTKSPVAGTALSGVVKAEAVDDYTLKLQLAWPNYPLMESLALMQYYQPLLPSHVEELGEDYGRQPMSVGPYMFKEWLTGERIVLERNPDFSWGPEYTDGGAPFLETIEFRIIPDYATVIAGLEAGEIDYARVQDKDLGRIEDTGQFQILGSLLQGISPMVSLNIAKPPFDDLRVRQAFNLAVNRDVLVQVVTMGQGIPQYGPVSASMPGYWPGVEYIGYGYDLDRAKELMEEAGYTYNNDGILEKDGQPLELILKTSPHDPFVKVAEVLQEQFKALGVGMELEQQEFSVLNVDYDSGDYTLGLDGWIHPDISVLYAMFHSSMIGVMNSGFVDDPVVDQLLGDMLYTADAETHEDAAIELQKRIVEQAYIIPLYTPTIHKALSTKVQGTGFSPITGNLELYDAYIDME